MKLPNDYNSSKQQQFCQFKKCQLTHGFHPPTLDDVLVTLVTDPTPQSTSWCRKFHWYIPFWEGVPQPCLLTLVGCSFYTCCSGLSQSLATKEVHKAFRLVVPNFARSIRTVRVSMLIQWETVSLTEAITRPIRVTFQMEYYVVTAPLTEAITRRIRVELQMEYYMAVTEWPL